ncbi:hypothetical protein [Occultella kanbiaonis]|uniref:hypothetical protein n=1 Tax=Occultella kanbiaonis TaxID=2675754 RepID=UPI00143D7A7E|nr:hypothetical protein [Occultella kanbiaonis]
MATSLRDVRAAFIGTCAGARAAGLDPTDWVLEEGSSTYGRLWRIIGRDPRTGGHYFVPGVSVPLGTTRSEALRSLEAMRAAWSALTDRRAS